MNLKSFILPAALALSALCASADAAMESKIDNLLSRMTLEEKIGQLNQLSGYGYAPAMVGQIKAGVVGSILNDVDPVTVNKLQRVAVDSTRLGIPLVFARDVIHGFKTIFPIPLGQAASWNPAIVEQGARIAADEASSAGVRWTFSPMLDIARDARWGRIAEGFGEDPYLTSVLGVAMVKGYQGDDLANPSSIAACAKHFAGYGASESGKDYNTTWIPEMQLRDVYLPPFKAAADAGAATFMCSFNDINGVPSSGNRHLLRDILRGEWGYDGLMVSDWGSIQQMIPHGFSADLRQAAEQAIAAGVDMDMEGYAFISHLKELVESGSVSMADVDNAVRNVLRLKYRLGLFDNPYVDEANANRFFLPASLDAATRAVQECAILLKNDNNVLPLKKGVKVAVIGPMADARHDQNGTWSFDMEKDRSVTPLESLRKLLGSKNVIYAPGVKYSRDRSTEGFAEALDAARQADVVIAFVGEEAVLSGEAHSRVDITLPGAQKELLQELAKAGKPLVTVYQTGRPMAIAQDAAVSDAVLYSYHAGTMAGPGLANLLTGAAVPSGHLPTVLPRMSGQTPLYYAHKNTGRPAEGITLIDDIDLEAGQTSTGCTSYFLDAGDGPLYPFGYGLSYTTFDYAAPVLSASEMGPDGSITVTCRVTNTGSREGAEVAQLYVRDMVGSLIRPVKELKGFEKFSLKPGESRDVTFTLNAADLGFHLLDNSYVVEPGDFQLWVAPNSAAGEPVAFKIVK
ncbi:MAG: glycosyl hydrolase [Bacteroidales bacterium]|nr:glycosyl hydrolase [Bacteroidales bacterium]MBD5377279.1 glycosyl hydrolase [Bacteroides sp.]